MADIVIPPPDAGGYRHFLYTTTDALDGRWYGGKRSTKNHPLSDRYIGSGNWVRSHPDRSRLKREIVGFFPSSAAVYAAEAKLVTWAVIMDDALCMNLWEGGQGITAEAAIHRGSATAWRENNLASIQLRSLNPEWRENQLVGAAKRLADPAWHEANQAAATARSADPKWIENHGAAMAILHADPQWKVNLRAGIVRRNSDPGWPAAHARGRAARMAKPGWKAKQTATIRRVTQTDEWKDAQLAGSRRRSVVFVHINGKRMTVGDACRETGVDYKLVLGRRRNGWPESQWFTPLRKQGSKK